MKISAIVGTDGNFNYNFVYTRQVCELKECEDTFRFILINFHHVNSGKTGQTMVYVIRHQSLKIFHAFGARI